MMSVSLEWVGLACFRLWKDGKPTIAMDPYTPSALRLPGDSEFRLKADTVIASSLTDRGHSYIKLIEGNPRVIDALAVAEGRDGATINGEPLITVKAAEVEDHPEGADDNALYAFKVDNLWFLHMGDLGYGLDVDQLSPFIGRCDVLLAIVGEGLTLKLHELEPMLDILKPKWIFPMHYYLPPVKGNMVSASEFIRRHQRNPIFYVRHHTVTFPIPKSENDQPVIVVLEPSGYQPEKYLY
jgi:hypothetical protein